MPISNVISINFYRNKSYNPRAESSSMDLMCFLVNPAPIVLSYINDFFINSYVIFKERFTFIFFERIVVAIDKLYDLFPSCMENSKLINISYIFSIASSGSLQFIYDICELPRPLLWKCLLTNEFRALASKTEEHLDRHSTMFLPNEL